MRLRNMFEVAFDGMDRDAVLRAYDTYRHRRATEYSERLALDSGADAQERVRAYDEWDRNAREAREAYVAGEIDAAEFLRRIEYDGEAPASVPAKPGKSAWQFKLERNLNFDPWLEYADMMSLDLARKIRIERSSPRRSVYGRRRRDTAACGTGTGKSRRGKTPRIDTAARALG